MEDRAMEEAVSLAMNYLLKNLGFSVIEMPTDIVGIDGTIKQEWDCAFMVDGVFIGGQTCDDDGQSVEDS
jgi:hypothetical protein